VIKKAIKKKLDSSEELPPQNFLSDNTIRIWL
jgi:hypothetical protein